MTVNYYVKCPMCNTITRMRSPAGYIYSTPVHIHCGKCNTLLTGEFISDNKKLEAYYVPLNCEQVRAEDYEYYGEASGEILCNKIEPLSGKKTDILPPKQSPVFDFLFSKDMEDNERFIDYACYICDLLEKWDYEKIKYDLFLNNNFDLIRDKYSSQATSCGYELNTKFDVLRFIYYSYFFDCGGIFNQKELKKQLISINYHFRHLDSIALKKYICYLNEENRLDIVQRKLFEVMFSFIKVSKYLTPAINAILYKNTNEIDKEKVGITTCTFEDIKQFYQDAFENLTECCDIVVGLDNIDNRNDFNLFTNKFDMTKFKQQSKGNRIIHLSKEEFFSKNFNMSSKSKELRNAIGHSDYSYNGISQELTYTVQSTGEIKKEYLLDIAVECVELMRSAYILTFYVYELFRNIARESAENVILHPMFYSQSKGQDRCPCGSNKKYNACCKNNLIKINKNANEYPQKANMLSILRK